MSFAQEPERKYSGIDAGQMQEFTVDCLAGENCAVLYSPYDKKDDARLYCNVKLNKKTPNAFIGGACVYAYKNTTNHSVKISLVVENNSHNFVKGEFWNKHD